MTCRHRLSVCRLMLIAMLAVQGFLAWHGSIHALDDHIAAVEHGQQHQRHQAGDVCSLCIFAQNSATILSWHGPVLQAVIVRPGFDVVPVTLGPHLPTLRFYPARAPPAA